MIFRPNIFETKSFLFLLALFLFAIYFSPYLIRGKDAYILIHDNLNQINMQGIFDGKFNTSFFPSSSVQHYTLPTTPMIFHLAHLKLDKLFFSFDYFWGFVFNELFYRLLSFIGLFFLLKNFIFKKKLPDYFALIFSFAWISLPFWPQGNLSISGIPLLLLGFIYIFQRRNLLLSYLIIFVYSCYSNFFFVGIYLLFALLILNLYLLWKGEKNIHFLLGSTLFLSLSLITHFPIFYNLFVLKIPTNRIAQSLTEYDFIGTIKNTIYIFINSNKLSHSFHVYIILPTAIIFSILILKKGKNREKKIIIGLWILQFIFLFIFGIYFFAPVMKFYNRLNLGFNFSRIYVLKTSVWYLLWAFCLNGFYLICEKKRIAKAIILILIILQIGINLSHSTVRAYNNYPGFKKFMSESQFDEIKSHVGENRAEYLIGCIGFFPAVANYNGFKTVGSFSSYYPLEFKKQFYKIIENELRSSEMLMDYFTNRGSALFLFDDKIGKKYYDQNYIRNNISKISCELNFRILRKYGVKYLFSTAKISNAEDIGLTLIFVSTNPQYYYRFYVYQI
ncbi:MAG: DUF6044 family protein [Candidatus Cloacimonadota bacterium]|nr:DUF6044 family protein [Candidatus Cloacimonadota bacterium]